MSALDLVEAREAVHVRHPHVEQDEVRLRAAHEGQHLCPRLRLADDLEVAVGLERTLDPVEDETVIVGDHDPHLGSVAQARDTAAGAEVPEPTRRSGFTHPRMGEAPARGI